MSSSISPGLRAFLTEVEIRGDAAGEIQPRGDGGLTIGRHVEFRALKAKRVGQDLGHDRECVDARIEDAHAAGLENPVLAGMPFAHILAPDDAALADGAVGQPAPCLCHGAGHAAVPCREQADPGGAGHVLKDMHLGQCRAGRLFQHQVAPAASTACATSKRGAGGRQRLTVPISGRAASMSAIPVKASTPSTRP